MSEQDTPEQEPTVLGLQGEPIGYPSGAWLAKVDESGRLVRQDGLLVRVRL